MTHILVTTDFSPESEAALQYTQDFAQILGEDKLQVTLLTVLEGLAQKGVQFQFALAILDSHGVRDELRKQAAEEVEQLRLQYFAKLSSSSKVVTASKAVHREIVDYAAKYKVDLIIIANHPRPSMSHVILGSVLEKVIRESKCPVIVVPAGK